MPTDKPYNVTVKMKELEKPSRRVLSEGAIGGLRAVAVVITNDDIHTTEDFEVLTNVDLHTMDGVQLWLALGAYLGRHAYQHNNTFQQLILEAALDAATRVMTDPEEALLLKQFASELNSALNKANNEALVKAAKRTSTEGTN
jgi:uncharacterized protein (DUF1778 family)